MTGFTPDAPVLHEIKNHSEELTKAEAGVAAFAAKRNNRWYPKFHIASNGGWINDPNGLCFYKGRWHVFYQLHPYGTQWGPMHWGHVSSTDMVNWKREPIMFAPSLEEEKDGVFSGSAVIGDDGKLKFYYTGHRWANGKDNTGGDWQVQMLAEPDNDELTSATKRGMVIDCPTDKVNHHYRDPKVWKTGDKWYMTFGVSSAEKRGQMWLFSSDDMVKWTYEQVLFEHPDPDVFMLECPDFFPLDGKQVLMLGPMEMLPKGEFHNGHNVIAFIGSYDEASHTFTKENVQLMDGGIDFYATQTTLAPDGRRIMTAWLQTWSDTEDKPRGCKWFGQTICPRELHIKDGRIIQTPVRELDAVHGKRTFHENVTVQGETSLEGIKGRVADLTVTVQPGEYRSFTLKLAADADHHTSLTYAPYTSELTLDRSYAGSRADIVHRRSCKVRSQNGALKLRILLDKNSIEVFANDGEQTMTAWIYTPQSADGIAFAADGEATITAEQFELNL